MSHIKDMIGKKIAKLTVLSRSGSDHKGSATWNCVCDCGNRTVVKGTDLRSGNTKSCGCGTVESIIKRSTKHGSVHTRLYSIYTGMKQRCYKENNPRYKDYGARGILICDEWLNDFQVFYNWAINNGYDDSLTIDRIDNDKNYCPENCMWKTYKEQNNNRRNNYSITINGETRSVPEWSEISGLTQNLIRQRIRSGVGGEKLLAPPSNSNAVNRSGKNRYIIINGVTKTITEWSKESGVSIQVISSRIKRGLPDYEWIKPV